MAYQKPFVAKLPTWNLLVTPYIFSPSTLVRVEGEAFFAQLYPPIRTSDNIGESDGYLVYPYGKGVLHDPKDYPSGGSDAISFSWGGREWFFIVEQVLPRWANFPNQHWLALLRRGSTTESANPELPIPPATPPIPGGPDCANCAIDTDSPKPAGSPITVTFTVRDESNSPIVGIRLWAAVFPASDSVTYDVGYQLSDAMGQASWQLTSATGQTAVVKILFPDLDPPKICGNVSIEWSDVTPEEHTFSVNSPLQVSADVDFAYQPRRSSVVIPLQLALSVSSSYDPAASNEAEAIVPLRIDADVGFTYEPAAPEFAPVSIQNGTASWSDGTCDACASLNSTSWPLNEITPHVDYETDPIDVECSGGTIQYTIAVTLSGTTITATMTNETASDVLATWVGTTVGWDGSSSIALAYVSTGADTACVVDTGFMDLHFS